MFFTSLRKRGQTIAELLLAYGFLGLFFGMRYILDRRHMPAYQIERFSPQYALLFNKSITNVTYYYPSNPCTSAIISNAVIGLNAIHSQFPLNITPLSEQGFLSLSDNDLKILHAYIIFQNMDYCVNQSTMPDQVEYTLRMQENGLYYFRPQRVKLKDTEIRTKRAPEDFCQDTSVLVDYVNKFLGLQLAIDMSAVAYATNTYQNLYTPNIVFNHFGCSGIDTDQLYTIYNFFIPIFITLIYLITFLITVGYMVEERANKTKEYLRIYGLRTWVNNLVWFSRSMCIYIVLTSVVTGFSMAVLPSSNLQQDSIAKAIFNKTHWTMIWTVLFVYSVQISAFAVFFSQFFQRPLLAKIFGFLLWFFTAIDFYADVPLGVLYFLSLFPNVGLIQCVKVLLQYERKATETTTYSQLYSNTFAYPLYIGISLLLMLVYSVIYMILAIYVERLNPGAFGISQPWNYIFKRDYWKSRRTFSVEQNDISQKKTKDDSIIESNHWIESSSLASIKKPILSIQNITKKFGKLDAVKNLSLDFYNGEVCALLGHNGAGKTTTTFILVGMLEPTSGSISMDTLDVQVHIQEVRRMIGFCPQYDILYNELTVIEHLKLVAEMRLIERHEADQSIKNILDLIGLDNQQHTLAKNLSGGMKRRLSIGISLVGDSKVLILDEPTSGIDPYNRRLIWTIIRKMRDAGKCIVMTTHFLEEADVLSDRIAVMSRGRLQANGTPEFLKQQTDFEYRIFIEQSQTCDIKQITEFLQKYVPNVVLERQAASELVFGIQRGASQQISRLLKGLEEQGSTVGIDGYGLSMTTVEEVFLKLVEEEYEENHHKIKENQEKTINNLADAVFHRNPVHITGIFLMWIRLYTLIIKRWILSRRQIFVLLGLFLGPLLIEILIISTLPSPKDIQATILQNERIKDAQVTLLPSIYNPHTVVIHSDEINNQMKGYLVNYLTEMGSNIDDISTRNITDYVRSRNTESYDVYVNKYQMGFSIRENFDSFTFNAHFSTVNYHTMATALNTITTCIFQYYANSTSKRIRTTNKPILTTSDSVTGRAIFYDRIYCFDTVPFSMLNFINGIIASIFISILALNVIRERISHSKELQLLTNTSKKLYWLSNFLYDFILCLIISSILTVVVKIGAEVHPNSEVEVNVYKGSEQIGYFFLLYVMFSLASLPFMYTYSFIPQSELIGFIMFLMINVLACFLDMVLGFIAVFSQASPSASVTEMGTTTRSMLILRSVLAGIFPTINFKQALFNIRLRSDPTCVSAINNIMMTNYSPEVAWTSFNEPGIGLKLIIFSGQIVFWFIVLACLETRINLKKYVCCCFKRTSQQSIDANNQRSYHVDSKVAVKWDDSKLDKDVRNERQMVLNNRDLLTSSVVLVRDLVQRFRKRKGKSFFSPYFTAVDHLNFYVPKKACFGLLGANGAGKTTTFRMLINANQPTTGEIIINGENINDIKGKVEMGFCPQFDWLIEDLNVVETLTLFAKLKGLSSAEISIICNQMIELFSLEPYRKRKVQNLSGGNKRKLSAAVAFMANPSLVFLDEPTTGLDAGAKRKLWSVIRAAREAGLTIIMTSHSMEECEALCTKIGIMKMGQFICLGNLQHLKNRFGKGYAVQIKVSHDKIVECQHELTELLPGIKIEDEQNSVLFCNVPFSSNLSLVFEVLNTKKEENMIESYSVSQTSLEQIFVRLAGHDVNDDDDNNNLNEIDGIVSQTGFHMNSIQHAITIDCANSTSALDNMDSDQLASVESIDIHL